MNAECIPRNANDPVWVEIRFRREKNQKLKKHLHVETEEKMKSTKEEVKVWSLHAGYWRR
jgi:hypothetical protein